MRRPQRKPGADALLAEAHTAHHGAREAFVAAGLPGLARDRGGCGRTAAILFSLASTCEVLGMGVFAYLRDVLGRFRTHPCRRVVKLPHDRWRAIQSGSGPFMSG